MQKLLEETKEKAYLFLREFGFEEDELDPIVKKGLKELQETLTDLSKLLKRTTIAHKDMDDVLHGLKGLLFQLGNHEAANKAEKLRYTEDMNEIHQWFDSL